MKSRYDLCSVSGCITSLSKIAWALLTVLTHWCFRVPLEIVVWIYDTFNNNLGIKIELTKYFKELEFFEFLCNFSFKYILHYALSSIISPKL